MRKTCCSGACAVVVGGYAKKLWEAGGGATRERKSAHTEKDEEGLGRKKMEAGLY